jgi:hypothetical protein
MITIPNAKFFLRVPSTNYTTDYILEKKGTQPHPMVTLHLTIQRAYE